MMSSLIRFFVLLLLSSAATQPRAAEPLALPDVFEQACLSTEAEQAAIAETAGRIGATPEAVGNLDGPLPPLVIAEQGWRWMLGDPQTKGPEGILLAASTGSVLDRPASGCMVLGLGTAAQADQMLALFETAQPIGKSKSVILPPYRYWLVDGDLGPAIYAAAAVSISDDVATLILALVRVGPDVVETLRQGL